MKNWKLKFVMVIVIALLVITLIIGCQPAGPKPSESVSTDTPLSTVEETEKPGGEPTCRWGEWQEVSTWDSGGYFLPEKEDMIKRYAHNGVSQGDFYDFILSPLFERGVTEHPQHLVTYLPISGGGPQVSPKNGEFYIHPDDQARLDQGEQPERVKVLWFGHVPSLEKKWGRLVNAKGESPSSEWIAFRFKVTNVNYGYLPQLVVNPTGKPVEIASSERTLLTLNLP